MGEKEAEGEKGFNFMTLIGGHGQKGKRREGGDSIQQRSDVSATRAPNHATPPTGNKASCATEVYLRYQTL